MGNNNRVEVKSYSSHFVVSVDQCTDCEMRLLNTLGQLVSTKKFSSSFQINHNGFVKGVHVLQILNRQGELVGVEKIEFR